MSSKMEQIIEEIEDYIDGCKPSPISRNKILVNREQLEELLSELRTKTPEEVKRYQKIISNKEAILADAQFAGSSSVPAHVEMMGLIGAGNNPMVGMTVAVAVAVEEAAKAGKF